MSSYILFVILTLLVGSFINVIIYRLPIMLKSSFITECSSALDIDHQNNIKINLCFPRSYCPKCDSKIPIWHNIPLISFILLHGKCIKCRQKISWSYPLVELLCGILSLFAALHFGLTIELIFPLLFIWILLALFCIDLKHQLLPDSLTLTLIWTGLVANINNLYTTLPNALLSTIAAYLALTLFIYLFKLVSGKVGMGRGDIKLFAAFGAWFGFEVLPQLLFIASLMGSIIGMFYLYKFKVHKNTPIPFGPFLATAAMIILFIRF